MPSGNREVIASTIFVPSVEGVVSAYKRNLSGTAGVNPTRIGIGHYACLVPEDLDQFHSSITHHATNQSGETRDVSVVISRNTPSTAITRLDVYIRASESFSGPIDDHLTADTVIGNGVSVAILSRAITVTDPAGSKVDVEFTFAGQAVNDATVFSAQLRVDGAPLDTFSDGTGEHSTGPGDLVSGSIRRVVTLPLGAHTIDVYATSVGGDFAINALTNFTKNNGVLITEVSNPGGTLTDDASFVEVTISRLPQ